MTEQRGKEEWLKMKREKRWDQAKQILWAETHGATNGGTKCLFFFFLHCQWVTRPKSETEDDGPSPGH
jgi:hypothetical protein